MQNRECLVLNDKQHTLKLLIFKLTYHFSMECEVRFDERQKRMIDLAASVLSDSCWYRGDESLWLVSNINERSCASDCELTHSIMCVHAFNPCKYCYSLYSFIKYHLNTLSWQSVKDGIVNYTISFQNLNRGFPMNIIKGKCWVVCIVVMRTTVVATKLWQGVTFYIVRRLVQGFEYEIGLTVNKISCYSISQCASFWYLFNNHFNKCIRFNH